MEPAIGTKQHDEEKRELGTRIEKIAWALLLIMTGALWLAPAGSAPDGAWLAGLGLILLGLNAARRYLGLDTEPVGVVVGAVALAAGIGRIQGWGLPILPLLLVALGAAMLIKAVLRTGKHGGTVGASGSRPC